LSTQNPIDQEGTYTLPEAQVDRFMLKVVIDYPTREEELKIIRQNIEGITLNPEKQVVHINDIIESRKLVKSIYMDEKIEQYILDIVFSTRQPEKYSLGAMKPLIANGASPRASINLALAAKAHAFINKRGFVIPDDVKSIAKDVMRHRIGLTYEAEAENMTSENIIDTILRTIQVP
jgi:MoxR-like ATPase